MISIVLPLYNEEETLPLLFERLKQLANNTKLPLEIILVNDGSVDSSLDLIRAYCRKETAFKYISFSRNFGHQIAVSAGLDHAKGDWIVMIDGDLQDPPELIPELYKKAQEGYEVVVAKRRKRAGESWFKKVTASLYYRILKKMVGFDIPLDTGDFRIMSRKVCDQLIGMRERNKFLRGQVAWLGYPYGVVEYDRAARQAGESHYPLKKMLKFALNGITAFSDRPISWIRSMASFFFMLTLLFAFLTILDKISPYLLVPYMYLTPAIICLATACILFSLSILGEYLYRMNSNILERPLYVIAESNIEPRQL